MAFLCFFVLIIPKQNIVDAKLHAFSMSVPSSSPWARPLPASFCLNSVKTTSIHFLSYLLNVSTLCNSSDDRIPNEVTMVLMHFFCHNPFMVKLREHQVPEMFALKKFAKNKQIFSFLFHEICILYTIFSRLGNPFVLRYIPRVPIMPHAPILALTW